MLSYEDDFLENRYGDRELDDYLKEFNDEPYLKSLLTHILYKYFSYLGKKGLLA